MCQFHTNITNGGYEDKQSMDILEHLFVLFVLFLSVVFLFFLERSMKKEPVVAVLQSSFWIIDVSKSTI